MKNSLDRLVSDGRTIAQVVLAPLLQAGVAPAVVDVGARNGMLLLPGSYTRHSTMIGFEPNPEEYQKLVQDNTDAKLAGFAGPRFAKTEYHNYALWDSETERNFYITKGTGACTMMGETKAEIAGRMYLCYPDSDPRSGGSFRDLHGEIKKIIPMPCKRLDDLISADRTIDLLKVDVEGAEMRVLNGAKKLFDAQNILFIYTEWVALPFYSEHPVFGDQHAFLRDQGMRLLDIEFSQAHYRRENGNIPLMGDRPLLRAGDACFALDPDLHDLSPQKRQRLAAISFSFGFNSFAVSLLREARLLDNRDIAKIEDALADIPLFRRLKTGWNRFPDRMKTGLRFLGVRGGFT